MVIDNSTVAKRQIQMLHLLLNSLMMSQTQKKGTTFYSSFTSSWRTEVMPAHHSLSYNHYGGKKNSMGINNLPGGGYMAYIMVDVFYSLSVCVCGLKSSIIYLFFPNRRIS